eukprot:gene8635-11069_t
MIVSYVVEGALFGLPRETTSVCCALATERLRTGGVHLALLFNALCLLEEHAVFEQQGWNKSFHNIRAAVYIKEDLDDLRDVHDEELKKAHQLIHAGERRVTAVCKALEMWMAVDPLVAEDVNAALSVAQDKGKRYCSPVYENGAGGSTGRQLEVELRTLFRNYARKSSLSMGFTATESTYSDGGGVGQLSGSTWDEVGSTGESEEELSVMSPGNSFSHSHGHHGRYFGGVILAILDSLRLRLRPGDLLLHLRISLETAAEQKRHGQSIAPLPSNPRHVRYGFRPHIFSSIGSQSYSIPLSPRTPGEELDRRVRGEGTRAVTAGSVEKPLVWEGRQRVLSCGSEKETAVHSTASPRLKIARFAPSTVNLMYTNHQASSRSGVEQSSLPTTPRPPRPPTLLPARAGTAPLPSSLSPYSSPRGRYQRGLQRAEETATESSPSSGLSYTLPHLFGYPD